MTNKLLLPHKFKRIGWILLIPATILGILITTADFNFSWLNLKVFAIIDSDFDKGQSFNFISDNITNELGAVLFIVAACFVAFSREKHEDEFIANLRLSSLLWAVWVSYILLLLAILFVYGSSFLAVMVYNMFTVLIIFIVRFNYILYKNSKSIPDEK